MKYFFLKLIAPRLDFMQTMTPDERELMKEHAAYLSIHMEKGWVRAYGPVADPAGAFGMALLTLPDDIEPQSITSEDPTVKANAGFRYEIFPMPLLTLRQ